MRFIQRDEFGNNVAVNIFWLQHTGECGKCGKVNIHKPATYAGTCPTGAQLLKEELHKRQLPIIKAKEVEIEKLAQAAGTFKTSKDRVKDISKFMKYVE